MIYWFIGQPGYGKTVLANSLKAFLELNKLKKVFHIDGDDLRDVLLNKDYSRTGREYNIKSAQNIARYLDNQGYDVVVSLVTPYRELREEFKSRGNVCEFYVHTTDIRGREQYHVTDFEPPLDKFTAVDTTEDTPEESLRLVLDYIYKREYEQ